MTHNKGVEKSLWVQLVLMAILFAGALIVLTTTQVPFTTALGIAVIAGFSPSGWSFLAKYFTPTGGYAYPMARWLNFTVQLATSLVIGIFVGPVYLYKAWKELKVIKQTQQIIKGE